MTRLTDMVEKALPVGAKVITVSNELRSSLLRLVWKASLPVSWGEATFYVYEKIHNRRLESVLLRAFFRK